jgi:hypothetical protein
MINTVYRVPGQLTAARPYGPASLDEMAQRYTGKPSPPQAEPAITRQITQTWLQRFCTDRHRAGQRATALEAAGPLPRPDRGGRRTGATCGLRRKHQPG